MRPGSLLLLALAFPALPFGCGPDEPALVEVGWRFADDRRCDATGVARVQLDSSGLDCDTSGCSWPCADGEGERAIPVMLTAGVRLSAIAESPQGTVLYRGSIELPSTLPQRVTLTLRYTGGQ